MICFGRLTFFEHMIRIAILKHFFITRHGWKNNNKNFAEFLHGKDFFLILLWLRYFLVC
jgi:hypothetical protein